MIPFKNTNGGGLIRMVIFIAIILIVLAYFGLNLRQIVASQTFQDNWQFLSNLGLNIWNNYILVAGGWIWKYFVSPFIIIK